MHNSKLVNTLANILIVVSVFFIGYYYGGVNSNCCRKDAAVKCDMKGHK